MLKSFTIFVIGVLVGAFAVDSYVEYEKAQMRAEIRAAVADIARIARDGVQQ